MPSADILGPLRALPLDHWDFAVEEVRRGPLRATWCEVRVHAHVHEHARGPGHWPAQGHEHAHRRLDDIERIIGESTLPEKVRARALAAFRLLGEAEGRVHGIPADQVTFHEVGAIDSIVDIVGVCLAVSILDPAGISCSPIPLGTGTVATAHGVLPVPAPATVEVLRGVPVRGVDVPFELTTPTGAALLVTLASRFGAGPDMVLSKIGYGAGSDRPTPVPNVLRVFQGVSSAAAETLVVLETNVDNVAAEATGHLLGALMDAGALDAYLTPIVMKKSRLAQKLSILCREQDRERFEQLIFQQIPTLGIRSHAVARHALDRRHVSVDTPWGTVRVKEAIRDGEVIHASPEYEDLKQVADERGIGLTRLRDEVLARYLGRHGTA